MAKCQADVRSLARSHTKAAIHALVRVMGSPQSSDRAVVSAAIALLDRGWGKPAQPIEGTDGPPIGLVAIRAFEDAVRIATERAAALEGRPEAISGPLVSETGFTAPDTPDESDAHPEAS